MAEPVHSIVPTLRRLRAEGVPAERHFSIVLADAIERLGQDGAADWLSSTLAAGDRVVQRIRYQAYERRIEALERKLRELEVRQ